MAVGMAWFRQRHADGDARRQFEVLARPLQDEVYRTARRLVGNVDDAEDLAQETFVRAFAAYHQFQPGTNFRAWIHRILRNLFIKQYYRRAPEPERLPETDEYGEPATPALEDVVFAEVLDAELERALNGLPEVFRVVIVLADIQEMSYDEIGRALGIPLGTVRSRLFRARRTLHTKLLEHARRQRWI
jgi:RNA polymerase sigma-70 factor, ECF subfamily